MRRLGGARDHRLAAYRQEPARSCRRTRWANRRNS